MGCQATVATCHAHSVRRYMVWPAPVAASHVHSVHRYMGWPATVATCHAHSVHRDTMWPATVAACHAHITLRYVGWTATVATCIWKAFGPSPMQDIYMVHTVCRPESEKIFSDKLLHTSSTSGLSLWPVCGHAEHRLHERLSAMQAFDSLDWHRHEVMVSVD